MHDFNPAFRISSSFVAENREGTVCKKIHPWIMAVIFYRIGLPVGKEWNPGEQTIMKLTGITVK